MLAGLTSIFFNLLLDDVKQSSGDTGVTIFVDEAGNVGRIADLAREVTLVRDLGIAFVFGVQSLSQLDDLYGHDNARTIRDNCLTWVALPGLRPDTAEQVSRALGESTTRVASDGRTATTAGGLLGRISRA